jgi:hypothetical protein
MGRIQIVRDKPNGSYSPTQATRKAKPSKRGKKPAAKSKPAESAQRKPAPDGQFWAAVREAKKLLNEIDARWWRLGELADSVVTVYGEDRLTTFAKEIGIAACTVERHRSTYRAWHPDGKAAPGPDCLPKSYAVARELQTLEERFEIVADNPHITKREAVEIRKGREGKGRGQKQKRTADWLRKNSQRWFQRVSELANEIDREVNLASHVDDPERKEIFREVIGPSGGLLPTIRSAGDSLIWLADYVEAILREGEEDADAAPEPEEDAEPEQAEAA